MTGVGYAGYSWAARASRLHTREKNTQHPVAIRNISIASACEDKDAAKRLKERTDIDIVGTRVLVSLVKREDLDRIGYGIALPKEGERAFQSAVENAAGNGVGSFSSSVEHATIILKRGMTSLLKEKAPGIT